VFAFLGELPETERPPIMPIPEHGRDEWRLDMAASATASSPQAVGGG
jgi:hypothetical protein